MITGNARAKEPGPVEYLSAAFEPSDRLAILLRNPRRQETVQRITTAARLAEPSFQAWLRYKNEGDGFDVYVGMNPLKPDARTRTKEDILVIRHLYVDLDHGGERSLAAMLQSDAVPPPNYVLSTSPGKFHAVWSVEDIEREPAERLLRQMARKLGGDPAATDSTRVLRLPGFTNRKYEERFVVRAELHSDRVHRPGEFKLQTEQDDPAYQPGMPAANRPPVTEPRGLTQSEHDWAFAKRSLARGIAPAEVIRSIGRFREGEKHNPFDYARRTVEKAKAQLDGQLRATAEGTSRESPIDP